MERNHSIKQIVSKWKVNHSINFLFYVDTPFISGVINRELSTFEYLKSDNIIVDKSIEWKRLISSVYECKE